MAVYYLCAMIALIGNLIGYKRILRLLLMIIYFLSLWDSFFIDSPFGLKLEIKCVMLSYFSLVQGAVFSANRTSHFLSAEVLSVGSSGDTNSNSKSVLTKLK